MDEYEEFPHDVDGPAPAWLGELGEEETPPERKGPRAKARQRRPPKARPTRIPANAGESLIVVFDEPERVGTKSFGLKFVTVGKDGTGATDPAVIDFPAGAVALRQREDGRFEVHIPMPLAKRHGIDRPDRVCVN